MGSFCWQCLRAVEDIIILSPNSISVTQESVKIYNMQLQNQLFNYFDHTSLIFCLFHSQWTHVGVTHNTHTHTHTRVNVTSNRTQTSSKCLVLLAEWTNVEPDISGDWRVLLLWSLSNWNHQVNVSSCSLVTWNILHRVHQIKQTTYKAHTPPPSTGLGLCLGLGCFLLKWLPQQHEG